MRRFIVAFLLSCASISQSAASGCGQLDVVDVKELRETTNKRVIRALDDVRWTSKDYRPVILCEFDPPSTRTAFAAEYEMGHFLIALRTDLPELFLDDELRAVVGHEMAHIILKHSSKFGAFASGDVAKQQQHELEADKLSARWFGGLASKRAMEKFLRAFPESRNPFLNKRLEILSQMPTLW